MGTLDEDARDLLLLVGLVVADRACWTRHARAAHRWKHRPAKPDRWVDGEASTDKAAVDRNSGTWSRISCNPRDRRATEWTVMGALEFCAEDPNGPDVIRALDLLLEVGRGWTISRIEELGHEWALWTIAVAVARPKGLNLSPRKAQETKRSKAAVDRSSEELPPATLRSSEVGRPQAA